MEKSSPDLITEGTLKAIKKKVRRIFLLTRWLFSFVRIIFLIRKLWKRNYQRFIRAEFLKCIQVPEIMAKYFNV